VYVYLAADAPDLGEAAQGVLTALQAGATPGVAIRVEVDDFGPGGHVRKRIDTSGSADAARFPERYDGAEESLAAFLSWAAADAPAEHTAVVVWGHGLGFRAPLEPPALGGLALDATPDTRLDTPALALALRALGPIDVFAADACLMQSLEATRPLWNAARYLVGSEQIEAHESLPYATWLPALRAAPADPRCAEADAVCRAVAALPGLQAAALAGTEAAAHVTLSVLATDALRTQVDPAWAGWAEAASAAATEPLTRVSLEMRLQGRDAPAVFLGGTRDAGATLAALAAAPEMPPHLRQASAALHAALADAVLAQVTAERYGPDALGVSLFLPATPAEYERRRFGLSGLGVPDVSGLYGAH
jgi:hypothetical protein